VDVLPLPHSLVYPCHCCHNLLLSTYLQAKRTNIAIALITNPRVLFLDEP
jgi:hypothetical protein